MPEIKTFVINGTRYEVVDETARESIKGLAPGGYGLGDITVRKPVTEANASGFFATDDTPDGLWAWGTRTKFSDNYTIEEVTYAAGRKMQRVWSNGVPGEWEYFNPTMQLGVEYRTTKRFNGWPVYTKAVWGGALPNTGYTSVTLTIDGGRPAIVGGYTVETTATSASGVTGSNLRNIGPWNNNDGNGINVNLSQNMAVIWCKIDRSSTNFIVVFEYVKY